MDDNIKRGLYLRRTYYTQKNNELCAVFQVRLDELQDILVFLPKVLVDIILKYYTNDIVVEIIFENDVVKICSREVKLYNRKFQFSFNLCNRDNIYYLFPNNMDNNNNKFNIYYNVGFSKILKRNIEYKNTFCKLCSEKYYVNDYLTFFEYYMKERSPEYYIKKKLFDCKTDSTIFCSGDEGLYFLENRITYHQLMILVQNNHILYDMIILLKHIVNGIINGKFKPKN